MRHLLKTLSVRASIVSQGAQRGFRIARALGSQNGCLNRQHRLDTESRRCMSGHGSLIGADGIVRSPIPDEVFPDLSLSDYIFSRLKLFGDKTALVMMFILFSLIQNFVFCCRCCFCCNFWWWCFNVIIHGNIACASGSSGKEPDFSSI